jgi:hypothetical protein
MSPVSDHPNVVSAEGAYGRIESDAPEDHDGSLQVLVNFENGERVWVPAERRWQNWPDSTRARRLRRARPTWKHWWRKPTWRRPNGRRVARPRTRPWLRLTPT